MSILDRNVLVSQGKGEDIPELSFEHGSAAEALICDIIGHIIGACNGDLLRSDRIQDIHENIVQAVREDDTLRKFPLAKKMLREQQRLEEQRLLATQQEQQAEIEAGLVINNEHDDSPHQNEEVDADRPDSIHVNHDDEHNEDQVQHEEKEGDGCNSEENVTDDEVHENFHANSPWPQLDEPHECKDNQLMVTENKLGEEEQQMNIEHEEFVSNEIDHIEDNEDARSHKSDIHEQDVALGNRNNTEEEEEKKNDDDNNSNTASQKDDMHDQTKEDENEAAAYNEDFKEHHSSEHNHDAKDAESARPASGALLHGTDFPTLNLASAATSLQYDPSPSMMHAEAEEHALLDENTNHNKAYYSSDVEQPHSHTSRSKRSSRASQRPPDQVCDEPHANSRSERNEERESYDHECDTGNERDHDQKYAEEESSDLQVHSDDEAQQLEHEEQQHHAYEHSHRPSQYASRDSHGLDLSPHQEAPLFTAVASHSRDGARHKESSRANSQAASFYDEASKPSTRPPSRASSHSDSPPRIASHDKRKHESVQAKEPTPVQKTPSIPTRAVKSTKPIDRIHNIHKEMRRDNTTVAEQPEKHSSGAGKAPATQKHRQTKPNNNSDLDLDDGVIDADDGMNNYAHTAQSMMNRSSVYRDIRDHYGHNRQGAGALSSSNQVRNGMMQAQYEITMQPPSIHHAAPFSLETHKPFNFDIEKQKLKNKKMRQVKRDLCHPMDNPTNNNAASSSSANPTTGKSSRITDSKNGKDTSSRKSASSSSNTSSPAPDGNAADSADANGAQKPKKADDPETEEIKRLKFNQEIDDLITDILGMQEELGDKFTQETRESAQNALKEKSRAALKLIRQNLKEKLELKRRTDSYQDYLTMGCSFFKGIIERFQPLGQRAAELDAVLARRNPEIRAKLMAFAKDKKVPFIDELSEKAAPLRTVYSILADADKETKAKEAEEKKMNEERKTKGETAQENAAKSHAASAAADNVTRSEDAKKRKKKKQRESDETSATTLLVMQTMERMNKTLETNQAVIMQLLSQQTANQHLVAQHAAQHGGLQAQMLQTPRNPYVQTGLVNPQSYAAASSHSVPTAASSHSQLNTTSSTSSPVPHVCAQAQIVSASAPMPAQPISLSQISLQVTKPVNHTPPSLPPTSAPAIVVPQQNDIVATSNTTSGNSSNNGAIAPQLLVDIPSFIDGQRVESSSPVDYMQLGNEHLSTIQEVEEDQKSPRTHSRATSSLSNSPVLVSPQGASPTGHESPVLVQNNPPTSEEADDDDDMMDFMRQQLNGD